MFYERLNQLCKLHGTTVTEVACTYLGVASSAATNWKRGASPRCDIVIRAAEHFGVTTDFLLGLSDSPAPAAASDADEALLQVAALLHGASATARTVALAALQTIVTTIDGASVEP